MGGTGKSPVFEGMRRKECFSQHEKRRKRPNTANICPERTNIKCTFQKSYTNFIVYSFQKWKAVQNQLWELPGFPLVAEGRRKHNDKYFLFI